MKKILASLLTLALLSGAVFAQTEADVSASATLSWGIDLGAGSGATPTHGFKNEFNIDFNFPLYKADLNHKGDADVYMEFDLATDIGIGIDDKTFSDGTGKVETKDLALLGKGIKDFGASVHFFGAYVTVYNRPSFETNYSNRYKPVFGSDDDLENKYVKGEIKGYGTTIGYANENIADTGIGLDIGLKFASNGAWDAEEVPAGYELRDLSEDKGEIDADGKALADYEGFVRHANGSWEPSGVQTGEKPPKGFKILAKTDKKDPKSSKYAFGVDVNFNFDKYVYLKTGVNLTFDPVKHYDNDVFEKIHEDSKYLGFGFKLGTKAIEGLDVNVAMDMLTNVVDANKIAFDLSLNAAYKWVYLGVFYGNENSGFTTSRDGDVIGDLGFAVGFVSSPDEEDPTNFLPGLGLAAQLNVNGVLGKLIQPLKDKKATVALGFSVGADYKATINDSMWIKPFFSLGGATNCRKYDGKDDPAKDYYFGLIYAVGVTFSPVEKVELTAKWAQGKKSDNTYAGVADFAHGKAEEALTPANNKSHNGQFILGLTIKY